MMPKDRLAPRPSWARLARVDSQAWTGFLFDAAQLTRDTALFVSLAEARSSFFWRSWAGSEAGGYRAARNRRRTCQRILPLLASNESRPHPAPARLVGTRSEGSDEVDNAMPPSGAPANAASPLRASAIVTRSSTATVAR